MRTITILGCGPSPGVPLIGDFWGSCDPKEPKNQRTRASILIEDHSLEKSIVIDTSPDFRQQLLREKVSWVDAALYTHIHADHTHGINDLFCLGRRQKQAIPIYADPETLAELKISHAYAFPHDQTEETDYYRPFLIPNEIKGGSLTLFDTLNFQHFEQDHGFSKSYGYRLDNFAYTTDVLEFPESSWEALKGVEIWVVDCLRYDAHTTHAHLEKTLSWIDKINPKKAYLTHMGTELDYQTLCNRLPNHIRPCYDGLKIHL